MGEYREFRKEPHPRPLTSIACPDAIKSIYTAIRSVQRQPRRHHQQQSRPQYHRLASHIDGIDKSVRNMKIRMDRRWSATCCEGDGQLDNSADEVSRRNRLSAIVPTVEQVLVPDTSAAIVRLRDQSERLRERR